MKPESGMPTTDGRQRRGVLLSDDAFDRFIAALDEPPQAIPEVAELFQRHPKLPET
jgi:uncharacterized protein (DUF1778 family)